ncbi:MAG TPA: hypothetical protein VFA20_05655 [Myxococcaceae bacterium]|nr:hypothetical protein [Myxococcaceae bacterium]
MPYDYTILTLPCGVQAIRADGYGIITKEDAELMAHKLGPGGPHERWPLLVGTARMEGLKPEARSIFSAKADTNAPHQWCAVVVSNSVLRVTINFMMRVSRIQTAKMFSREPEGIAWLDERVREDAAKQPGSTP